MYPTIRPTLQRLVPREELETTAHGYELQSDARGLLEFEHLIDWLDCSCPKQAQFVLVDAPDGLTGWNCDRLLEAIDRRPVGARVRLVCGLAALQDVAVARTLMRRNVGLLLDLERFSDFKQVADNGILGVRLGHRLIQGFTSMDICAAAHELIDSARDMGMRTVASRVPALLTDRALFEAEFDYVSRNGSAIRTERSNEAGVRMPA